MVELGQKVVDRITGFTGIVTGLVHYISGCDQALVVPRVGADGKLEESHWFDVQRLDVLLDEVAVTLDNTLTPGPDALPPIR